MILIVMNIEEILIQMLIVMSIVAYLILIRNHMIAVLVHKSVQVHMHHHQYLAPTLMASVPNYLE